MISKINQEVIKRGILESFINELSEQQRRQTGRNNRRRKKISDIRKEIKAEYIEGVVESSSLRKLNGAIVMAKKHNQIIKDVLYNMSQTIDAVLFEVTLKSISKVLINTSMGYGYSILEIGFPLHHLYGIPYIPSSAIKGAWRTAFREVIELCGLPNSLIDDLFGSSSGGRLRPSKIIVTDFLLVDKETTERVTDDRNDEDMVLVPDILTPHYTSRVSTELDVQPVPIQFIALNKDLVFQGFVFIRDKDLESSESCGTLGSVKIGDLLVGSLKIAGKFLGIGGKTAVGYSRFEVSVEEVS